jgi:hypothetical protein
MLEEVLGTSVCSCQHAYEGRVVHCKGSPRLFGCCAIMYGCMQLTVNHLFPVRTCWRLAQLMLICGCMHHDRHHNRLAPARLAYTAMQLMGFHSAKSGRERHHPGRDACER